MESAVLLKRFEPCSLTLPFVYLFLTLFAFLGMFLREIVRRDYYPEIELALSELSSLVLRIETLLLKGFFVVLSFF